MNEDILKGSCLEIKGMVKERWGKLTDNEFGEIEGKGLILLGRLRKQFGYLREKAKPEYKDTFELAKIITSISRIMKTNDSVAMTFIARYGQPLSSMHQESQITGMEEKHGHDTDRYFDTRLSRRNTRLAPQ